MPRLPGFNSQPAPVYDSNETNSSTAL
jgi:hypothetical protein